MLRPDTERLWNFLKTEPGLAHFVLVGGTALSMHLNHRVSEDLDFTISQARLPHRSIEILKRFALKCMACADRSKSRDWLDLYLNLPRPKGRGF